VASTVAKARMGPLTAEDLLCRERPKMKNERERLLSEKGMAPVAFEAGRVSNASVSDFETDVVTITVPTDMESR